MVQGCCSRNSNLLRSRDCLREQNEESPDWKAQQRATPVLPGYRTTIARTSHRISSKNPAPSGCLPMLEPNVRRRGVLLGSRPRKLPDHFPQVDNHTTMRRGFAGARERARPPECLHERLHLGHCEARTAMRQAGFSRPTEASKASVGGKNGGLGARNGAGSRSVFGTTVRDGDTMKPCG